MTKIVITQHTAYASLGLDFNGSTILNYSTCMVSTQPSIKEWSKEKKLRDTNAITHSNYATRHKFSFMTINTWIPTPHSWNLPILFHHCTLSLIIRIMILSSQIQNNGKSIKTTQCSCHIFQQIEFVSVETQMILRKYQG